MALRFGLFPSPALEDLAAASRAVEEADRVGLDLVGIQDHPYQRRFLDAFTLISWYAARTERVSFFPDVANLPLRPPGVLAKQAASLSLLTGGRFVLGLGAGGFWDAIEGLGGPRRSPGDAVGALVEAIEVLRALWSGGRGLRYEGRHYRLAGVHGGPSPSSPIPVWVGGTGPRMLGVVGRMCDGWVVSSPYNPPEVLGEMHARIDEAALEAGRDPGGVARVYNVSGVITDGPSRGFLRGPMGQWVDELRRLHREHRMDTFVLWPEEDVVEQVRRFALVADTLRGEG